MHHGAEYRLRFSKIEYIYYNRHLLTFKHNQCARCQCSMRYAEASYSDDLGENVTSLNSPSAREGYSMHVK